MQAVGYRTSDDAPAIRVAEDGVVTDVALDPGTELDFALGERRCAGAVDGDTHYACENADAPYCHQHSDIWVCAKCTGDCLKAEMDCHEDHAVYLAAFAPDTFKVGVTREWRLETRLREQGADRAAHVRTVENGRLAREIEAGIAETMRDRVRVPRKIAGFADRVNEDAWRDLLADFDVVDEFAFDYGFTLDSAPVPETLAAGTVRGVKGRVLLLENAGTTYAVDLRGLVGYELEAGGRVRDRQSSLDAF